MDEALRVPGINLRLFGKPESFTQRRMGVALARAGDVETAQGKAKLAASKVKPRKVQRWDYEKKWPLALIQ